MNCKKIQELILTDYVDGELDEKTRRLVEDHLEVCEQCRQLEQKARAASTLFKQTQPARPPEKLWDSIKNAIEPRERENPLKGFVERLRAPLVIRKPGLVAAAVIILVFVAGVYTRAFLNRYALNTYLEEQVAFFEELANGSGNGYEYPDIGIPMEDVFS